MVLESVQCAAKIAARLYWRSESSSQPAGNNFPSDHINFGAMDPDAQRQKRRDIVLSSLNVAIEASNLAKEFCSITPAKPVFSSLSVILTMIKVYLLLRCLYRLIEYIQESMTNEDCVELGLACADCPQPRIRWEVVERP